jgi:uncharacterized membrane protein YhaH (DUF805 family)
MSTEKILMGAGTALFVVMAVLLKVGTTSAGLFVTYGILAVMGACTAMVGKRLHDRGRS